MPRDRENIVPLEADHSGLCKFGDSEEDLGNLARIEGNIHDLYEQAIKVGESIQDTLPNAPDKELEARVAGLSSPE